MRRVGERVGEEVTGWPWVRWVQLGTEYRPGSVHWAGEVSALFALDLLREAERRGIELVAGAFRATLVVHLADGHRVDPYLLGWHMLEQAQANNASVATTLVLLAPHPYEGDTDWQVAASTLKRACETSSAQEGFPGSPFWRIFYVGISNEAGVRFSPGQRDALAAELVRLLIIDARGGFWSWLRASEPENGTVASVGIARLTSGGEASLRGVRALTIRHLLEALEPYDALPSISVGLEKVVELREELYKAAEDGEEKEKLWERAQGWAGKRLGEAARDLPRRSSPNLADLSQVVNAMVRGVEAAWATAHANLQRAQFELAAAQVKPLPPPPPPLPPPPPPVPIQRQGCLAVLLSWLTLPQPAAPPEPPAPHRDDSQAKLAGLRQREQMLQRAVRTLADLNEEIDKVVNRLQGLATELRRIGEEAAVAAVGGGADEISIDLSASGGVELLYRLITLPESERIELFGGGWLWQLAFRPASEVLEAFAEECIQYGAESPAKLDVIELMQDRLKSSALTWNEWEQVALPVCPPEALPGRAHGTVLVGRTEAIRRIAEDYSADWIVLDSMGENELMLVRVSLGLDKDGLARALRGRESDG